MEQKKTDFFERFGIDAYLPDRDGLLYKYFTFDRALQVIKESKLYFAPPTQLNDSFELDTDKIIFEITDDNIRLLAARHFSNDKLKQEELFVKSKGNRQFVPKALKIELEKLRNKAGVCCFTSDPRNKLMWGHYGSSDTGVCIGFDFPIISIEEPDLFIMKVLYEDKRSFINYFDNPFKIFPHWAFVKNSDWKYEREFRAVHMEHNGLMSYNIKSIKEIHYGMRISKGDIAQIESLLALKDFTDYKKFQIQRSENNYDLISAPF